MALSDAQRRALLWECKESLRWVKDQLDYAKVLPGRYAVIASDTLSEEGKIACTYCLGRWNKEREIQHADDCPYAKAEALLAKLEEIE